MSGSRLRRLKNEAEQSLKNSAEGITYGPIDASMDEWQAIVIGPKDSVYAGLEINVLITLPEKYPFVAPTMKTNLFHPNVYTNGQICMSLLHNGTDSTDYEKTCERWMPSKSLLVCLLSFQQILTIPNCMSPANLEAAMMFLNDKEKFTDLAQTRLIKEQQDREFEKCQLADQIRLQKRKRIMESHEQQSNKIKKISEEDQLKFASLVPEEPITGGIYVKMRSHEGSFQRTFPEDKKMIAIFDYLGSKGIIVDAIIIREVGRIDRVEAEKKDFNDFGLKNSVSLDVDKKEDLE